ncbi:3-beta hydroxysteroid dehydrogenase [Nocardioides albidus]|uniref:3-beta hydroxysteroid dehydrogenase n=1 Tax=Nocardioides albidus TaxID=1517589 RepID=A0A5C4WGF2_9ACTN|nr:NAD(P)H-binding protein [Nocardioides albidus]TNM47221.1 3-beta hydroxysteroid dehydrogenase [Nocardioides albidus]
MDIIAVAGGTGLVGAMAVEEVRRVGATPVVIARSRGVDLTTGAGLAAALDGVDAVIDASNVQTLSGRRSVEFFEAATGHLLTAGAAAGVRHHVALSIVGCDRVDLPYYLGKRRQEELVAAGPVPWSVLRATQFHEFAGQLAQRSPRPFAMAPRMRTQPIAAREVAAALVAAALGEPAGLLPDLGGPRPEDMGRMVRDVVRARGPRRLVVPVPMAGRTGRQVKAGGLLPGAGARLGTETFDEWLARV